jgi:protease PrsW
VRPWFFSPYGRKRVLRLWGPVLAISVLCVGTALLLWSRINRNRTPIERIARLAQIGEFEKAERLSWQILQAHPTDLETWIRFIDMHAARHRDDEGEALASDNVITPSVSESAIQKLLARIGNAEVATLASYWYKARSGTAKPDAARVTALADAPRPARLANYLLARTAMVTEDWATGARRFEREGLSFPKEGRRNLRHALSIWIDHDAWDEVRKRSHDRRYAGVWDGRFRLELATHDRDWPVILLWCWAAGFVNVQAWPVALAILAAVLWFIIAARLGRIGDSVPGRRPLYALAFILGIASIYPTILVITIEESIFGLKLLDQPVPDAIYFIFGVGLREEASKLLLFLPLLPALLRRGSRIEAMTCGALVGLGFAAEENISYFHEMAAGAALSRFLTANFLHMSLTALVALSVYDTKRGRATSRDGFSVVFPLAVFIHGIYDFFLSSADLPGFSIFSMALFIIIARQFLRQLLVASSRQEEQGALRLLVASLTLLTGVSYIYATTLVGPLSAISLISIGLIGNTIVIYMFVRELGPA